MRFGHFDDRCREYVITRPDTPLPWINYLGSDDFYGLISNTAGGYAFYKDARLRRLTRYRYNNVPLDSGGRYLYLRDAASGAYWSPTWQPTQTPLDQYTCRHGLGYTRISSEKDGIAADTLYFVPPHDTLEIWQTRITNQRYEPAEIDLFSAVEFCLWDAWDDATNFQRNLSIGEVEVDGGVIYHKSEYRERRNHFAYFACSEPLTGFDTQREAFLGPYGSWASPRVVAEGGSTGSVAHGWAPIGSHRVTLRLAPGETRQVIFLLGYHENPPAEKFDPLHPGCLNKDSVRVKIAEYMNPGRVKIAFDALRQRWDELLGILQVATPDEHTNRMVNIWNAYQCMVTFNMSRSASYFESGIGRGMGFRDSTQDLLGFVQMVPERARQRLLDVAATQFENGGAYHQYSPLTKRGNHDVGSNFNDDPLWLVLAAAAYLKETGDLAALQELTPFDNRPELAAPLLEHLRRSIQYTLDRIGPHGLPLIGRADWNDCLNLNCYSDTPGQSFQTTTNKEGKVAESVFIAGLFVLAARELAGIYQRIDQPELADGCLEEAQRMEAVVRAAGWDGDWFLRAYDDRGDKVGSAECAEGQIYIEPQGICVMAGIGTKNGLAQTALDSVRQRLATRHGIVLQQPAYSQYYLNLGEISSYPPGYKENAGIFCHTNPWIMIAEALIGRGDAAHDYYIRINPSAREEISEVHRCEPYIYAQMIAGSDAPTHGEAKNSWLSGTAVWNFVAITQWILGIRPAHDGLVIHPVLPVDWPGFTARRVFRGVTYDIHVERQGPGGQVRLYANGELLDGDIVLVPTDGTSEVLVEVIIG